MEKELLTPEIKDSLRENFKKHLKGDVNTLLFTKKGSNDQYNELATELMSQITAIEGRIKSGFHEIGSEAAGRHKIKRSPTLMIAPEKYSIRFTGTPLGEEGRSLVMALIMASSGKSMLSDDSRDRLKRLKGKRHVRVFTSPT